MHRLFSLPGVGGSSPKPPPPPPPPPTQIDARSSAARKLQLEKRRALSGLSGAVRNTGGSLGLPAVTSGGQSTLLGG